MTVIAKPIESNLLKAVKCAHLSRAFIIFFYLFGFRQVLLFLGSPIMGLLQIFSSSFCPEPLTYFIKCALWQFKCKTKLTKAFDGRSCLTARLHGSGEDADVRTDNREEAHREWESSRVLLWFWSQCNNSNNNNNNREAHRLSVVPIAFAHMFTGGFKTYNGPHMNQPCGLNSQAGEVANTLDL